MTAAKMIILATAAVTCLSGGAVLAQRGSAVQTPELSWETLKTDPYEGKRDDVSFADPRHGWYGTGKGDLFATSDAGDSWTKVATHPGTFIRAVGFVDTKTGFIGNVGTGYYPGVTDTTPLYRTDDGGKSWKAVDIGGMTVAGICSIDILKTQRIFQGKLAPAVVITAAGRVGGPAAMIRSTDTGQTWHATDMTAWTAMILDVHFVDEQTGYVAGSSSADVKTTNAQILMTRDGGRTWHEVYKSKRPSELIWKMSWPTRTVGYATVMSYDQSNASKIVIKTTDGGLHWREMPLVENGKAVELGIGFMDSRHGWVGTTVGGFETHDGGSTFAPAPIAPAANKFRIVPQPRGNPAVYAIGTKLQRLLPSG